MGALKFVILVSPRVFRAKHQYFERSRSSLGANAKKNRNICYKMVSLGVKRARATSRLVSIRDLIKKFRRTSSFVSYVSPPGSKYFSLVIRCFVSGSF